VHLQELPPPCSRGGLRRREHGDRGQYFKQHEKFFLTGFEGKSVSPGSRADTSKLEGEGNATKKGKNLGKRVVFKKGRKRKACEGGESCLKRKLKAPKKQLWVLPGDQDGKNRCNHGPPLWGHWANFSHIYWGGGRKTPAAHRGGLRFFAITQKEKRRKPARTDDGRCYGIDGGGWETAGGGGVWPNLVAKAKDLH